MNSNPRRLTELKANRRDHYLACRLNLARSAGAFLLLGIAAIGIARAQNTA